MLLVWDTDLGQPDGSHPHLDGCRAQKPQMDFQRAGTNISSQTASACSWFVLQSVRATNKSVVGCRLMEREDTIMEMDSTSIFTSPTVPFV